MGEYALENALNARVDGVDDAVELIVDEDGVIGANSLAWVAGIRGLPEVGAAVVLVVNGVNAGAVDDSEGADEVVDGNEAFCGGGCFFDDGLGVEGFVLIFLVAQGISFVFSGVCDGTDNVSFNNDAAIKSKSSALLLLLSRADIDV